MNPMKSLREHRSFTHHIPKPPAEVFPLLCPIREFEWLSGWHCTMVHSGSGLAESGAVFITEAPGEEPTVWTISHHDPGAHVVEFVCVTPGSRVRVLEIALSENPAGGTDLTWSHTYTTLGKPGEAFLAHFTPEAYRKTMGFVTRSLDHFCRTGLRLPAEE
jgi:Polyketide cyclase / dehydrase and lipid transport